MRQLIAILVFLAILVPPASYAKRGPKPKVDPVEYLGIRYTSHGDGRSPMVEAKNIKTGETLWDVTVFHIVINPLLEEDVQWVFIKQMFIKEGKLIIVAENTRTYSLELQSGAVKRLRGLSATGAKPN